MPDPPISNYSKLENDNLRWGGKNSLSLWIDETG